MSLEIEMSFWEVVGTTIFVLGVGFVSGRILGVHRGFLRATAAGVLGSFVGLLNVEPGFDASRSVMAARQQTAPVTSTVRVQVERKDACTQGCVCAYDNTLRGQ